MRKTLTICITLLLFSSCNVNPDKRSTFLIESKELKNYLLNGKYKYTIRLDYSNIEVIYFYSDSNWNVGDTLKLTK